ncbi:MAG: hypothetical protein AAGB31_04075 [Bdellovibrio sp.]
MKLWITFFTVFAFFSPTYAVKTMAIKERKVLLDLENESWQKGDRLMARNADGKARALLEVQQVKGNKAVAILVKGQIQKDYALTRFTPKDKNTKTAGRTSPRQGAWGGMAGYTMNSMTVKPSGASSVSLSGNSFNLAAFYEMHVDGNISARFLGGYEALNASGTSSSSSCMGSSNCTVDLGYLGLTALVRYTFLKMSSWDMWGGAGLGFLFALSKSSNILDTSKITTNQTIVGALGVDYHLGKESFIPFQLDYALFPDNNTSSANQIILRLGYGFSF